MQIANRRQDGVMVVSISGRIDHLSAGSLEDALAPYLRDCGKESCPMVVDLSGVDYVSSAGLRILMLAAKAMKTQGQGIVVAALQPVVQEIFEISRFDKVFEVFESTEAAVARLAPPVQRGPIA
jgi:anti-sigma B factor antagonist